MNATPVLDHWIDGTTSAGSSTRLSPVYNPAKGIVAKHVRLATTPDVDAAVASALAAFPAWRDTSQARRQTIMFTFRELLNERQHELAEILTAEHGKVISDARGEIARGLEVVEFALGMPHLSKGEFSENVSTGVDVYSLRQPLGVVGIISPFNFPAMVPLWFFPIAIAAGNAVVLKPSEKDPSASMWMAALMTEAGLPPGIFNVVHGDKEAVDAMLEHPDVQAISFVGSTPIAQYIYEMAAANGKRVQSLGGAKNHMLVLPDADLELTADAAINSAFGSAGERCMAISVLIAVDPIADALIPRITERMRKLKVGDGTRACDMGPLITEAHRDKVASYVDIAAADGAEVVVDGRGIPVDGDASGFWMGPTLIDKVSTDSAAYRDEIFGPVLTIIPYDTEADAVAIANDSPYGLAGGVWAGTPERALAVAKQLRTGQVDINGGRFNVLAPFGGYKKSGIGREIGPLALEEFFQLKSIQR